MSAFIDLLPDFKRRLKRLSRKFRSLPDEVDKLLDSLEANPNQGKSGGFRVIAYYVEQTAAGETVYLVTIYDKSEEASIGKDELLSHLRHELPPTS